MPNQIDPNIEFFKIYLEKEWKFHVDELFDKTFTLRHWTVILGMLKQYDKFGKVLQIGSGPGYVLQVLKEFGADAVGVEPFVLPINTSLEVHKYQIQDILDEDSDLNNRLLNKRFDAIISHDVFTESVMFDKKKCVDVIDKLKDKLNSNGIMLLGFTNEGCIFSSEDILAKRFRFFNGFDEEQELIMFSK